jgi:hypothetical protein
MDTYKLPSAYHSLASFSSGVCALGCRKFAGNWIVIQDSNGMMYAPMVEQFTWETVALGIGGGETESSLSTLAEAAATFDTSFRPPQSPKLDHRELCARDSPPPKE